MKVLVVGGGQLAWDLMQTAPAGVHVTMAGRDELDITLSDACEYVLQGRRPEVVINAAAYTAVDKAESEREAAFAVNEQGVANLAAACQSVRARLFHVSTDFVFDGQGNRPYVPDDAANPPSVYGASKLAGETVLRRQLPGSVIVRTSWLYSRNGGNFVKTMLRLMAEKPSLNVVVDQLGAPTWAAGLAGALWSAIEREVPGGIYHWSDAGVASWYDFAVAIQDIALELGILDSAIPIRPIPSSEFPTPAKRPAYSVLDTRSTQEAFGLEAVHWRRQLKSMLETLP
ncbi:dTDP-4-dehydrorhamnose reductase [Marinimicrobium agarilyticum]|uniref:dTDP-4-dehydrorhamnose reductase n=1 Tax=Marinimicrobium agarilyticum TaxID=306546 RepID=UPI0003FA3444|nr:dTDP-4-dehydrorhamnose reductase [Marinimicrobium agarilyticum]